MFGTSKISSKNPIYSDKPGRFSFRTRALDEAQELYEKVHQAGQIEPLRRDRFGWAVQQRRLGGVCIFESRWEGSTRIRTAEVQRYSILVPTAGGGELRVGGDAIELTHGQAVAVVSPGTAVEVRMRPHLHVLNIGIEPAELERQLGLLSGEAPQRPPRFKTGIEPRTGLSMSHLARALQSEVESADGDPGLVSSMRDGLLSCLLRRQPRDLSALMCSPPRRLAPASVRRAEEYLEAHLDTPLTVGEVAQQLGVSVRSLQHAFKCFRGVTPMAFLRERRLARARQILLAGGPKATVAAVARSVAMPHLGRFASEYRGRYGEYPSETLLSAGGAGAGAAGQAPDRRL